LLKFFHEFRSLFRLLSSFSGEFQAMLRGGKSSFGLSSVFDLAEVFSNGNDRDLQIVFEFPTAPQAVASPGPSTVTRLDINIAKGTNIWLGRLVTAEGPVDTRTVVWQGTRLRHQDGLEVAELSHMFEEFEALADTLYIGPFRNAINVGANENYFDIQVGQAFISSWRAFKTGNVKRDNELILRLTEDIKRIFEFNDLQIDASNDGRTLQVFVNGRSYKLPELGSGLAQFILVLGNAAIRQPAYILIDEPELNLHPSLMLDFLTTLASYARAGIMFGTHSIGLARAAGDRIYSLRKLAEGQSEVKDYEATPRLSEFLGELSFSGYRELGFDKILLVEAPHDVKSVQQFLRLHKMDHKIVLLPTLVQIRFRFVEQKRLSTW